MKIFLSIWLSAVFLITGLPVSWQEQSFRYPGEEALSEQAQKQEEPAHILLGEEEYAEQTLKVPKKKEAISGPDISEDRDVPV